MKPWTIRPSLYLSSAAIASKLARLRDMIGQGDGPETLHAATLFGVEFRRELSDGYVRETFGDTVRSGPFKGMHYPASVADGSLTSPKLLGCYEAELHPVFEALTGYTDFIDIGCDEGYYAVGVARAAPEIQVHAFDINPTAQAACRTLAELNGVVDRISIDGRCDPERLGALARPGALVLIDIEGGECDLLQETGAQSLRHADLVVEAHLVGGKSTADAVAELLADSHDVTVVPQQPRDPRQFPELLVLSELQRFLAQWEGRNADPWIVARAR